MAEVRQTVVVKLDMDDSDAFDPTFDPTRVRLEPWPISSRARLNG